MTLIGPKGLPIFFAVTLGVLALYSLYRARRVSDLLSEPHGHFTPMLRTSHTVLELMPDTPETPHEPASDPDAQPEPAYAGQER